MKIIFACEKHARIVEIVFMPVLRLLSRCGENHYKTPI